MRDESKDIGAIEASAGCGCNEEDTEQIKRRKRLHEMEDTDLLTAGQYQTIQWQELWTDKITLDKEEVPLLTSDKLISISHFYKAGTLLLLLVLNLHLCENVASLPVNVRGTGNNQVYLQDLFNHAIRLSYNISELNREMRKMFMLELNKDEKNMLKMLDSCHSPPINTPKTIQESRKLSVHPGIEHDYAEWSDLKSLQAADEETCLSSLFKLSFCLAIDTYMVDLNLKYLISGALLLLVVPNLLLWENVASVPLSTNETDDDNLYLEELFDHAMILLHNISKLNIEMRKIYMLEYFEDQEFLVKTLTCCHNYTIKTPKNMDAIQKISVEDFPKLILSRVQAWNDTLHNLLTILESTPGTHDAVLSIARDIRTKNAELFEASKKILNKIYGKIEIVDHAVLTGLEDFQSSDEDFRLFALCKLSYCLRQDMNMVNIYLQLLSCVMLVKSDVCLYPQIRDNS
ncbi:prolactin-7A1-like [Arvicola amphibius]|uniref:prolactin-7A1-like n=1 Tax=Arvicola amphibius TaxID=1047088 RepID=UPI001C08C4BC|nr:prolactin-7A1-like [Arvicola amphibius]